MRRFLVLVCALVALPLVGCAMPQRKPASHAVIVDSQGTTSVGTRSASDGSPAPGRQEFVGIYVPPMPFLPWDLDFRGSITGDPSKGPTLPIIVGPTPPTAPAPSSFAAQGACPPGWIEERRFVPAPRVAPPAPRTVTIPVPQEAVPCPAPPPEPTACMSPDCGVPQG
jgi:hypothetical protein